MAINQEAIEGNWNEIKGRLRERWGEFSDRELEQVRGNMDQLVGLIQQKTGEARAAVESYLERATSDGASAVQRAADAVRSGANQAGDAAHHAVERIAEAVRP